VWTTFSDDQIDLNAANLRCCWNCCALLFYVRQGADLIRLDAIAYLWKTIGTSCIHLEQTHLIVQLMRDVLDLAAPSVLLVTETNVPHDENISYFGDGSNEAQMVYQFSLPPLVLHTFLTGDASALSGWAATLRRISDRTTFFNFLASHDGIGVQPARGILSDDEIGALVALAEEHGGFVSYKSDSDGSRSAYELNITYFDAITHPAITAKDPATACQRFICSQAIMLAFMGVPGVYFHSLFGSRNFREGVQQTGRYRSINREKLDVDSLEAELASTDSIRSQVYTQYVRLLRIRTGEAVFHPLGGQTVLDLHPAVFSLERVSPDGAQRIIALHNVRGETVEVEIQGGAAREWRDLVSGQRYTASGVLRLGLTPYQVCWLKPVGTPLL
jgi:sucrose phosphorylase